MDAVSANLLSFNPEDQEQGKNKVEFLSQRSHKIALVYAAMMAIAMPAHAAPRIIDGDTIEVDGETVRILNIDAPELHHAGCDAEKRLAVLARKRVRELIGDGSSVTLLRGDGNRTKDRHGRTLARVLVNGADIGEILVMDGLARPWEGKRQSWCNR
jgi:endonuclease YncB( thermonuclease family)